MVLKSALAAVLGGLAVCAAGDVLAGKPEKTAPPPATSGGVAESGMRAYVNPESGALVSRPATRSQADALALPEPDMSKIREIKHTDGSTTWQFNGQVNEALVAQRGADGKLRVRCGEHGVVHDHAELQPEVSNER